MDEPGDGGKYTFEDFCTDDLCNDWAWKPWTLNEHENPESSDAASMSAGIIVLSALVLSLDLEKFL